jgi:hypothetical protein
LVILIRAADLRSESSLLLWFLEDLSLLDFGQPLNAFASFSEPSIDFDHSLEQPPSWRRLLYSQINTLLSRLQLLPPCLRRQIMRISPWWGKGR